MQSLKKIEAKEKKELAHLLNETGANKQNDAEICAYFGYEVFYSEALNKYFYSLGKTDDFEYWHPNKKLLDVPNYTTSVDTILYELEKNNLFDAKVSYYDLHSLMNEALKALNFKYHWATDFSTKEQREELPLQMLVYFFQYKKLTTEEYMAQHNAEMEAHKQTVIDRMIARGDHENANKLIAAMKKEKEENANK